ncbi:MAG: BACON domain-containing carbohydrate-binding protein [Acidobacteria bacterium]|nr:BACON domain-containing carbohydrate-binding protein [Acidobacteriota bacterium]
MPSRPAGAAVDSTNALSTSLMGLYLLNEGSGTTVKNLVNGQMAAFAGGAPPTWNAADPSVVFQGGGSLNSYINAGTDASFDRLPTSAITIVAKVWVNKLEAGGICEKNDLNQADGILFGWDANGSLRFTLERAGTNLRATTNTAAVQVGKWQQVALTWDGTVATAAAVRIYVDGVSQTISGGSDGSGGIGYAGATNQPFRIGNASFDPMAGALNGKMAYLAVYRGRILTAAELNQFDARLPVSGGTAACTYSISPISAQPGAAGSSGTVEVTAGSGCSWTAVSQASWITITSAASGAGSGMVGYSVAANTGAARSGNIAVAGQTFTVNQAAAGGTTGLPSRPAGAAVDSANALSTSLVGLYLMNESSGATVKNLVNGQTAVFAGAAPPGWNTAEPSVIFQGGGSLNSFVNAGTDAGFDRLPTSTITIVAKVWVNKLEAAGICEKNDGNQADGILFGWATSGSLRLTVERPGSDLRVVSATSAVKAGKWQQIALTWDGTAGNVAAAHFYVDGALQSVSDGSEGSGTIGYAGATNQPFRIGNASFDPMAGALNGRMAYFAVYRGRILTPAELNQLDARLPITEGK